MSAIWVMLFMLLTLGVEGYIAFVFYLSDRSFKDVQGISK
jgi:hypothetical protein